VPKTGLFDLPSKLLSQTAARGAEDFQRCSREPQPRQWKQSFEATALHIDTKIQEMLRGRQKPNGKSYRLTTREKEKDGKGE
jgi:hypothetical protein